VEWTEATPLNEENLNSLELRISEADAGLAAGKLNTYNAIAAKNVTPTSQAFADLITAINAIDLGTGNATASDLIAGKTATVALGAKITGTMPVASGVVITPSTADQTIPESYYNGTTGAGKVSAMALIAGDFELCNTPPGTWNGGVTTKVREIRILSSGTVRVKFDMKVSSTSFGIRGQIYKNGVAAGTLRETFLATFTTYTEDITVASNDLIQLYMTNGTTGNSYQNFSLYASLPYPACEITL